MPEYINIYTDRDFHRRPQNSHLRLYNSEYIYIYDGHNISDANAVTWDLSNCKIIWNMFGGCYYVPNISGWNTVSCENFRHAFSGCPYFNIPIAFNMKNNKDDECIFNECFSLKI